MTLPPDAARAAHDAVTATLDTAAAADQLHERVDSGLALGVRRQVDVRARLAVGAAVDLEASLAAVATSTRGAVMTAHDCYHGIVERPCKAPTIYGTPEAEP